jgi:Flp pilus assembly pilin Flp
MKKIMNFINDESGIETLEYAIVAAIVAAVALLIYGSGWGGSVQNTLKNAAATSTTGATL